MAVDETVVDAQVRAVTVAVLEPSVLLFFLQATKMAIENIAVAKVIVILVFMLSGLKCNKKVG